MKIIRPENLNEFKKEEIIVAKDEDNAERKDENCSLIIDGREVMPFEQEVLEMNFDKPNSIEQLMQQTINENKIKVEITLTKRQKELFDKKGGEKWLKKVLIGQTKGAKHGNKR